MILGLLFIAGALGLVIYNHHESERAGRSSAAALSILLSAIEENEADRDPSLDAEFIYADQSRIYPEMDTEEIDGNLYIGVLEIPALDISLPVMADWDYAKLTVAPCRYAGSYYTKDLVISGHNYPEHFSPLKSVGLGTDVYFTNVNGAVYHYKVTNREIVQPTAIEEMITGDWDLTLFTCTTGGRTRCAVRCRLATE